jgi:hypothetical protein
VISRDLEKAMATLDGIGAKDCPRWRNQIFERYPHIAFYLIVHYRRLADTEGHVAANAWLRDLEPRLRLGETGLSLDSEEEGLKKYATRLARHLSRKILSRLDSENPLAILVTVKPWVEEMGVTPLPAAKASEDKIASALRRYCDEDWWFKRLRSHQRKAREALIRELGFVHKKRDLYVSELTFKRRVAQILRNRQLLEVLLAENEEGARYTLAELQDLSPGNPVVRRAELMVRLSGFEEVARRIGGRYVAIFFTLTAPSKYHVSGQNGRPNPKYDGSTPLDAHNALNDVWARTRAAWDRAGIRTFGMRVVEPHHDGTPHWHLLLFIPAGYVDTAVKIFRSYALQEDGSERGAHKHRLKVERIDPAKGSATGYIAKYVAKNIDGVGIDTDNYGRDAIVSACRIEAWASTWRIRQFQQIGGPPITVWRELRRIARQAGQDDLFEEIRQAADDSDWARYTELMGGACCRRDARPIRPLRLVTKARNKYGEVVRSLKGVMYKAEAIITRIHTWTILYRPVGGIRASILVGAAERRGELGPVSEAAPDGVTSLEYCQ